MATPLQQPGYGRGLDTSVGGRQGGKDGRMDRQTVERKEGQGGGQQMFRPVN